MLCQVNLISSEEGSSTHKILGSSDQRKRDLYASQRGAEWVFNQQLEVRGRDGSSECTCAELCVQPGLQQEKMPPSFLDSYLCSNRNKGSFPE